MVDRLVAIKTGSQKQQWILERWNTLKDVRCPPRLQLSQPRAKFNYKNRRGNPRHGGDHPLSE